MSRDSVETNPPAPAADDATRPAADAAPRPQIKRAIRKRRSPWVMRGVVLAILAALVALAPRLLKKQPLAVEVVKVERGEVRDEISSSTAGEVMAERTAMVRAELAARVLAVKHKRGERVKRGEVVVSLDASDVEARVHQAQATLDAQRAQAAQADAHAEATARSAERHRKLADHGAEATQVADDAEALSREAQAAAKSAHGLYEQSAAALQVSRVARGRADLAAPFDGLLAEVYVNPGDAAQPASNIFQIVDDSRLHVEATIDEADIGRVKVGQGASLRLDALPNQPIPGVVSKLDPTVRKDEKGARTLRLEVAVADLAAAVKAGVRPGMSANVDVRVADKPDVLSLPTNVIVGRGTKRTVYVVEAGFARQRVVDVGMSSWERSEIISGVAEGEQVIASLNVKDLADGVAVAAGGKHVP